MSKRARSRNQAVRRYKRGLQKALTCLTGTDIWITPADTTGSEEFLLTVAGGEPVMLSCGNHDLFFDASQRFSVYHDGREFRVRTLGYIYTMSSSETLETEVVSWHWHPRTRSRPHIHVGGLALGHVPTGRVTFEAVARYAIEDLGATPGRDDWEDVLMETEARHAKFRSWSVAPNVDPTDEA